MANTTALKNKNGKIYAYQIRVFKGRNSEGKQLKPYSMVWHVPKGWRSSSVEKELNRVATEFEMNCKIGKISSDKKTFAEYAKYVMELKSRDCKHRTIVRYNELLERINEEIGYLKLANITVEHLNAFYLKLAEKGQNKKTGGELSNKTILEYHRLIHSIFEIALKERIVNFNIADSATPPKCPKKEAEFFELNEIYEIMSALENENLKYKVIMRTLIESGARRGEVLGIKWDSINYDEEAIIIKQAVLYSKEKGVYIETTKTNETRLVHVSPQLILELKQLKALQKKEKLKLGSYWTDTGLCFTNQSGLPMHPDTLNSWIKRFQKKHNLPHINPHKFRHTQATLLYAEKENPITISKRLGHKQTSTTQNIYAHLMVNSDKDASNTVTKILYHKEA